MANRHATINGRDCVILTKTVQSTAQLSVCMTMWTTCIAQLLNSGVTRGLSQGEANLAEGGPLANVCYAIISSQNSYVILQKQKIFVGWCNELQLGKIKISPFHVTFYLKLIPINDLRLSKLGLWFFVWPPQIWIQVINS